MLKIPISGGPHTGKTTLLNALQETYPEAYFVDEAAERVISAELLKEERSQSYQGIFPWNHYPEFAKLAIQESVELEANIPEDANLVFQDRGLIDNVGYSRLNDCEHTIPEIVGLIQAANYAFALFCKPVGEYTTTLVRRETPEQAQRTHEYLAEAYDQSGIEVLHLPAVSVEERLEIIRVAIDIQFVFINRHVSSTIGS